MTNEGAVNGRIFLRFVKRRLAPWLKPGDIVVLDNLNFHKMVAVRRAIEAAGALTPSRCSAGRYAGFALRSRSIESTAGFEAPSPKPRSSDRCFSA